MTAPRRKPPTYALGVGELDDLIACLWDARQAQQFQLAPSTLRRLDALRAKLVAWRREVEDFERGAGR